jgi:hypothetical protein
VVTFHYLLLSSYYCICPHTTPSVLILHAYLSSYYYICARILLYLCVHSTIYVLAFYYICTLVLLYVCLVDAMCPHTTRCVRVCPHTTICVLILLYVLILLCVLMLLYMSSYYYICVLILLYMCPHPTICVLVPLCMCPELSGDESRVIRRRRRHMGRWMHRIRDDDPRLSMGT